TKLAQRIELGSAHLAAAHDLDRVDQRRMDRKDALNALAIGNFANREALVKAAALTRDHDALIGLHARALAFLNLDVHDHRVAGAKIGDGLACEKARRLLGLELSDEVHGSNLLPFRAFFASGRARAFRDAVLN